MRQTAIAAGTALIAAIVAMWGASLATTQSPRTEGLAPAPASVDVMQMMKDAKHLPAQQYSAH
jgi:hypothetical protein